MVLQIAALQNQLGSASAQLQDSTAQATLFLQDLTEARTAADGTSARRVSMEQQVRVSTYLPQCTTTVL